ncbi:BRO family protein [Endozoicomonas acroporae]|uniref:BRO family protein n=1 Tax=Endozoicomonas acroporae TaxID=1701104 RepID=UPI003D79320A
MLGYSDTAKAISTHCKAFKTTSILELHKSGDASSYNELRASGYSHNDLVRKFQIIPERDVYRLVMRSKLPAAEEFNTEIFKNSYPKIPDLMQGSFSRVFSGIKSGCFSAMLMLPVVPG